MKIKIYLFRLTVAVVAFLFATGIYTTWRYLRLAAKLPKAEIIKTDLSNLREAAAVNSANSEVEKEPAAFDPEGNYNFADDPPKGFEDFDYFAIENKNYATKNEDEYGKLIAPQGYLQTAKEFKFKRIGIGGGQIQFETDSRKGISYSFSGKFTETRNFIDLDPEKVARVLEGRLVKKRDGKQIAAADVTFGWFYELGCGC